MRKLTLLILLCLIAVFGFAVTVETGSFRNFLIGSEPNSSYDNWVSHVAEGIAIANYNLYAPYDVQTNGFGDFRIPNGTDLIYWNNMLDLFCAGDYDGAQAVLTSNSAPFEIIEFHDTETGRLYYVIREIPNMSYYDDNDTFDTYDDEIGAFAYGWGLFVYNPEGSKPVIVTIPHPCDDYPSPLIGYRAFTSWDAKYLLINGAGREVRWTNEGTYTNTKSISDPTRYALHPFQTAYKKFADKIRGETGWREFSAQLHTYDWNRHVGYPDNQISAGNPRLCPNLPIRDLSYLKRDLINQGRHLMIPANTIGIHRDVYLNDYYSVNYSVHDFIFTDGEHTYPVNSSISLPAYTQNQQMLYTQSGTTDYDVYDPFFHLEMDELPNAYEETTNNLKWFYGWNEAEQKWDMANLFTRFEEYYSYWIEDLEPVLVQMFQMNDGFTPEAPQNLAVLNQSLTNVTLTWTRSSDYDFDSYEILYGTQPISFGNYQVFNRSNNAFLASQACESIAVTGLNNANQYYFRIRAKDKNGNVSDLSNEVNTVLAPANVTSLAAYGLDGVVRLTWQVGTQTNNQGFSVYRKPLEGDYALLDSWQTNSALTNPTASSFEWWDSAVVNGDVYTYKISSTNTNNLEFFYNFPASASPRRIHFISIRNSNSTMADSIAFSANPYATDGNDAYWDVTKSNPGSNYVWNAFWEQYWGNSGTQLAREVKGDFDVDTQMKTWVMRTRSDQLSQTLSISASGTFGRAEKLYLLDGGNGTYHNLLSGPYQFTNANSNIRTMTLFWGNMQPRALISSMPNRIYQGGGSITFNWNYQYPFLVDHLELSIQNSSDSLLVNPNIPASDYSYTWYVPQNVIDMQECYLVIDVVAVDGVRTRFISDYRFALVPLMNMAYNEPGWKTRSNPWPNAALSVEQIFGAGAVAWQAGTLAQWEETGDFVFNTAYWVHSPEVSFYSSVSPVRSEELSFPVQTGWNFVPNPHMCAYDLEDISFLLNGNLFRFSELVAQKLVSPAVYVMRDNQYLPVDRIEPWESLVFKYYGPEGFVPTIRFYPFFNGPDFSPQPPNWELQISAAQNGRVTQAKLGAHSLATDNFDYRLDLPTPLTPPFDALRLWFSVAEADTLAYESALRTDYKRNFVGDEQQKFWDLCLQTDSVEPITFGFNQLGIPDGWQLKLVLDGIPYFIFSSEEFVWTPPAAGIYTGFVRVSNFIVGVDDLIQPPISALKAYPNPFNPSVSIAFNLALGGMVSVEVFNIRGQKVAILLDSTLQQGRHTLLWDGKDSSGRSVSSGIYFARVQTKGSAQSIKMMLVK